MKTRSLVIMAMLTAILFLGQVCMAFLPNIEVVTLLVILYTQVYKKKVFFIIYAFALLEGVFYGFGIWWFNYLYVWSILALIVLVVKSESPLVWSIIAGAMGWPLDFCVRCRILYQAVWAAVWPIGSQGCISMCCTASAMWLSVWSYISRCIIF